MSASFAEGRSPESDHFLRHAARSSGFSPWVETGFSQRLQRGIALFSSRSALEVAGLTWANLRTPV